MSQPQQPYQPFEQSAWPPASRPTSPVPAHTAGGPVSPGDLLEWSSPDGSMGTTVRPGRRGRMTGAEKFWYVLGCIGFAAAYFAKIPAKKALAEYGYGTMTGAEKFWYVLMCVGFGAGYFAKVPIKKAFAEALPTRAVR